MRQESLDDYGIEIDGFIRGATDFLQPVLFRQEALPLADSVVSITTKRKGVYTTPSCRIDLRAPRQPGQRMIARAALPHQRPLGWRAGWAPPTSVSLGWPNSSGRLTGPARYRAPSSRLQRNQPSTPSASRRGCRKEQGNRSQVGPCPTCAANAATADGTQWSSQFSRQ